MICQLMRKPLGVPIELGVAEPPSLELERHRVGLRPHLGFDRVVDAIEGQRHLRPLAEALEAKLVFQR